MADNMGGISTAWFILSSLVERVTENRISTSVILKSGKTWTQIKLGRYGANVKVEPQESDAGTLYNITATLQIPRQNLNDASIEYFMRLSRGTAVMKYQNYNGDVFIVGSPRFPLKCKLEVLHPSSPGGYSGYKLTVTGKQLTPQLILQD